MAESEKEPDASNSRGLKGGDRVSWSSCCPPIPASPFGASVDEEAPDIRPCGSWLLHSCFPWASPAFQPEREQFALVSCPIWRSQLGCEDLQTVCPSTLGITGSLAGKQMAQPLGLKDTALFSPEFLQPLGFSKIARS